MSPFSIITLWFEVDKEKNNKNFLQIDTFSTHILLNQLKITGFGMFNINLRTVYLVR